MTYYVRKINKKKSLEKIQNANSISNILADVLNEFRVTDGDLSVWEINDKTELNIAILSIAITSEKLDRMDFMLIPKEIIMQCGFNVEVGPSGQNLCASLEQRHYNIKNLTVGNINKCVEIYKKTIEGLDLDSINDVIPRRTEKEIGKIIKEALNKNEIEEDDINPQCLKYIKDKNPQILQ